MVAPIALFVYKRLWHTQQVVQALADNFMASQTDLVIFSDGPKNEADREQVEQVRNFIHTVRGFRSVTIMESPSNKGLANSIISGVTQVLSQHASVIVLEDDLVTSRYFLSYMNQGLALYAADDNVISIHGYSYPLSGKLPETFFIKGADCWGWATWRRGWELFEKDGNKLLRELREKGLSEEFDFNNAYPFTKMLEDQIQGRNDSWAIRWAASAFLKNKLTLYPGISLVKNIGFDESGTHTKFAASEYDSPLLSGEMLMERISPVENGDIRSKMSSFFWQLKKTPLERLLRRVYRLFKTR